MYILIDLCAKEIIKRNQTIPNHLYFWLFLEITTLHKYKVGAMVHCIEYQFSYIHQYFALKNTRVIHIIGSKS